MNQDLIILIVQIVAALGVVISVFYLGIQIHQQNKITKAQFGHSLTQRMYERYFNTCLLYTSPSPRDKRQSRMPSSA